MGFSDAVDDSLAEAMVVDPTIIILGEDVHTLRANLFVRFGEQRVRATPISESAFLGASVSMAMAGLRPVVEIMLVDFIGVAMDALMNQAAKLSTFSGGRWNSPLVIRASCGGGYGDGGQHEQCLWGWLAHIPGLVVVVPSTPADAGGLMASALEYPGPVIFLEHKLLSKQWLELLGSGGRRTTHYDVPDEGTAGLVPEIWKSLPIGKAFVLRKGNDLTLASLGVGVHRSLSVAKDLEKQGISAEIIDLRSVSPLDRESICESVKKTGRLLVVDEDYEGFGLSGEVAAVALESGLSFRYARVCTRTTIPYNRKLEDLVLPNINSISAAALKLLNI